MNPKDINKNDTPQLVFGTETHATHFLDSPTASERAEGPADERAAKKPPVDAAWCSAFPKSAAHIINNLAMKLDALENVSASPSAAVDQLMKLVRQAIADDYVARTTPDSGFGDFGYMASLALEAVEKFARSRLAAATPVASPTEILDGPQHCRDCLTACHDCPAGFVPLAAAPEAPPPVEARQPPNLNFVHDVLQNCRGMLPEKDGAHAEIGKAMEIIRAALAAPAGAIQPHLDHQVESSSGTAAALGRITLLKGSVVKMGGLPHELLADVESYCASRAAAPQGGDTGAPS